MGKNHGLTISKFNPEKHNLYNKIIVVLGPRGAGKTFFVKHLLTLIKDIPVLTILNGTEELTETYSKFCPKICVHEEYDPDIITRFMERQKKITKLKKSDPKFRNVDNRGLLLMDDLAYDKSSLQSEEMRYIFLNGRHAGVTFILAMQTVMDIKPDMRDNIDYVFMCNFKGPNTQKKLYENYTDGFKNLKSFQKVLNSVCVDHRLLVIHKSSKERKLEDFIFTIKADKDGHPNFRLGCPDLWELSGKTYDNNYREKKKQEVMKQKDEEDRKKKMKKNNELDKLYSGDNLDVIISDL